MESVEIETAQGNFSLEIGEDSRGFLWLFEMAQHELIKSEMNTEIVTSRFVKYSGSDPRMARVFINTVADIVQGRKPMDGWGPWAGQYAKKFAAETCKRDIKVYSLGLIVGLIVFGPIAIFNFESEMGTLLQMFILLCSFLTVFGFYKILLFSMDLFHFRGGVWPEIDGKNDISQP